MTPTRRARVAWTGAACGLLALSACGSPGSGASTEAAAPADTSNAVNDPPATAPATVSRTNSAAPETATGLADGSATAVAAPVEVSPLLQISSPLVGGGTLDLASYAGKPVALWFWAPT